MGLLDFFSAQAGQDRRQWLNRQEDTVEEYLRGYLGPAANPVMSAAQIGGLLSPGADMMDAQSYSRDMWNADSAIDAATAGAGLVGATAMMAIPGNLGLARQGFDDIVDAGVAAYDPSVVNAFTAYHGSPHTFDRFSMDRIGTGEGAQAYGHGLYFAENEGIARSYRDKLTDPQFTVSHAYAGQPLNPDNRVDRLIQMGLGQYSQRPVPDAIRSLESLRSQVVSDDVLPFYDEAIARLRSAPTTGEVGPGSLYQVQIDADPSQLLDWDAPLSAQPQGVREWFDSRGIGPGFAGGQSGGSLYLAERSAFGGAPETSQAMLDGGVQGIRYLDHGSRFNAADGLSQGDLTRNYVIFDDSLITILKRYGIGGAVAGGGWAMTPQETQAAQDAGLIDPAANDRQIILDWLNSQGL